MKADVAVVVPTCRGYDIPHQTMPVDWFIVHDRQEWEITHDHVRRADTCPPGIISHILAPEPAVYGERTSAIRSAGLDAAYDQGYRYVLTLDDDCKIPAYWAAAHVCALSQSVPYCNNTVPGEVIRGLTHGHCLPVGISHGLWSGILDYPAWHQLFEDPGPVEIEDKGFKKISSPFPMCGMNVGFRREVLPAVYFQHTFGRHDDIFAGWMAQQVLDLHGYGFVSGGAVVRHERASNAQENYRKEMPGDRINRQLLRHIRSWQQTFGSVAGTYGLLAAHVGTLRVGDRKLDDQIQQMAHSMLTWANRRTE